MKRTQSQAHGQDLAQVAGRAWGRGRSLQGGWRPEAPGGGAVAHLGGFHTRFVGRYYCYD